MDCLYLTQPLWRQRLASQPSGVGLVWITHLGTLRLHPGQAILEGEGIPHVKRTEYILDETPEGTR